MVPLTFQKATELYSSQLVCCLSTSDGKKYKQLSYRIQLVEGLFTKYARAAETRSVPGRQASDNTIPRLAERHFLKIMAPKLKNQILRGVLCAQSTEKRNFSVLLPNM